MEKQLSALSLDELHAVEKAAKSIRPTHSDAKKWLDIVQENNNVRCVEAHVPEFILPNGYSATIIDVRVFGKRRAPDDVLYNKHAELRDKVARGNAVLCWKHKDDTTYEFLIYALKKFTGGMGDEDDCTLEDNVREKYFLKDVCAATRVICTQKANGEAAHFSARKIGDKIYVCVGSKNVHMLISKRADIALYTDSRYQVARVVADAVMDVLEKIDPEKYCNLLQFLHDTQLTAVLELLQPEYQHVENLSHLEKPELRFVVWTRPYEENNTSFCAMAPDTGLAIARFFGLTTVWSNTIDASAAEEKMTEIRREYGYEGQVLYFIDSQNNVIGLVKKKTAWYILCRAIRERAANALTASVKRDNLGYEEKAAASVRKRMREIKKWLDLPEAFTEQWTVLGIGYVKWLLSQHRRKLFQGDSRSSFPILWEKYLLERGRTDKISMNT